MKPIGYYNDSGCPDPTAYIALNRVEEELRATKYRPVVYICSPYSGDIEANTASARRYCRFAVDQGCVPVAPHLLFPQFMDDRIPGERRLAIQMDMILLSKCRELWAFGSHISPGMSAEILRARDRHMTVRFFTDQCKEDK